MNNSHTHYLRNPKAAPFVVIQRSANETTFKGFCLEIIDTLKSFYNFTYRTFSSY